MSRVRDAAQKRNEVALLADSVYCAYSRSRRHKSCDDGASPENKSCIGRRTVLAAIRNGAARQNRPRGSSAASAEARKIASFDDVVMGAVPILEGAPNLI